MMTAFQVALAAAIKSNPAGLKGEAIAARMGIHHSVLYRWAEVGSSRQMPLDRVIQFTLITGDSRPLAALCHAAGGAFIPLPADDAKCSDRDLVRTIKEFSDLAQVVSAAKADGKVDEFELAKINREGAECQRAIAQLLGALETEAAR